MEHPFLLVRRATFHIENKKIISDEKDFIDR